MKKIKPLKRRGFRRWLRRVFKVHSPHNEWLRAYQSIDEWDKAGMPPERIRSILMGTTSQKACRVWVGLDLSKGKDYTVKVTPSRDGKSARYTFIDEAPTKEAAK